MCIYTYIYKYLRGFVTGRGRGVREQVALYSLGGQARRSRLTEGLGDQIGLFSATGWRWRSPESDDLWFTSGGSKETVWSCSGSWWLRGCSQKA